MQRALRTSAHLRIGLFSRLGERRAGAPAKRDGQVLHAKHTGWHQPRPLRQLEVLKVSQQDVEYHARFQTSEMRSQTHMRASAHREMRVWGPPEIKAVWFDKHRVVAVG